MPFTEKHKDILIVLGALLGFLFLAWLFFMWGSASRAADADKRFAGEITKDIEQFANVDNPALVSQLSADYERANQTLTKDFEDLSLAALYKFPQPLIPPDVLAQNHVRIQLRSERDYVARQFGAVKNIRLNPTAATLGLNPPTAVTEALALDELWMRQLIVVRRFVDVLLTVPDEESGEPAIYEVSLLRPLAPVNSGTAPAFLRAYPVEIQLEITFGGLLRLLAKCAEPETMHTIHSLEISAAPVDRLTRFNRDRDNEKLTITDWFTNYYRVHLIAATLEPLTAEEVKNVENTMKPTTTKSPTVIRH